MRGIVCAFAVCVLVAGCTSGTELRQLGKNKSLGAEGPQQPVAHEGWRIEVSLEPSDLGPIAVSLGPLRPAPRNDARPWVQHELVFENRGDRTIRFADTRTSTFIGPAGHRTLLVADQGCGYAPEAGGSRLEAGACLSYLDAFVVKPHGSVSRTITLFKGLSGMDRIAAGTYVFERLVRFRVGHEVPDESSGRTAVLRLVYEVAAAGR